jgi:hypothetical protein
VTRRLYKRSGGFTDDQTGSYWWPGGFTGGQAGLLVAGQTGLLAARRGKFKRQPDGLRKHTDRWITGDRVYKHMNLRAAEKLHKQLGGLQATVGLQMFIGIGIYK